MGRDISGQSIQDVIDMIAETQEEIDLVLTNDIEAFGVKIGWTDASGEYMEETRSIPVKVVAQIHNEGLSNGHGGFHTEWRYLEQTLMWMEETQGSAFQVVAYLYSIGDSAQAVNLLTEIGERGKEYLRTLIQKYNLIDTQRLINSIIIEYTDENGNELGGVNG